MEDLNKETQWEDENLNSQEQEGQSQWEEPKKVFTLEEVEAMKKEMNSNSEKWVQKVISEKKTFETALKESKVIAVSPERLVELYEENPNVAKLILDEFFNGQSIEEYKEDIEYKEDYSDPKVMQSKIKKEAEKIAQNNLIESKKQNFIDKLKMSDEEKASFEEAFEELRELKSFSTKDLTKQFEKAYRLSNDNEEALKKLSNQEVVAQTMATWEWKWWEWNKTKKENNPFDDIFKKYNT